MEGYYRHGHKRTCQEVEMKELMILKVIDAEEVQGQTPFVNVKTDKGLFCCYNSSVSDFLAVKSQSIECEMTQSKKGNLYISKVIGTAKSEPLRAASSSRSDDTNRLIVAQVAVKESVNLCNGGKITKDQIAETADWLMTIIMTLARDRSQEVKK